MLTLQYTIPISPYIYRWVRNLFHKPKSVESYKPTRRLKGVSNTDTTMTVNRFFVWTFTQHHLFMCRSHSCLLFPHSIWLVNFSGTDNQLNPFTFQGFIVIGNSLVLFCILVSMKWSIQQNYSKQVLACQIDYLLPLFNAKQSVRTSSVNKSRQKDWFSYHKFFIRAVQRKYSMFPDWVIKETQTGNQEQTTVTWTTVYTRCFLYPILFLHCCL